MSDLEIRVIALREAAKMVDDPREVVPLAEYFFQFLKGELSE
jgi:hypothetical protein